MTTLDIRAPEEQTEGTRSQVLRWLKSVGEPVTENEPLIELETDKVTVEVAAPGDGVLSEILRQAQEEIGPGDILGRITTAATSDTATEAGAVAVAVSKPESRLTGNGQAAPSARAGGNLMATRFSPAVRRLMEEHGLQAADIRGSGAGGRITVEDIHQHLGTRRQPVAQTDAGQGVPSHTIPHTPIRKRIAEHMVQSLLQTAPHVTTVFEVDMSAVLAHRARHRADFERRDASLTLTAYFLAATVDAIRAVPEANSRWTDSALQIYDVIHVGVATALEEGGLVVPVLRDVQSRDLFTIAQGLQDLVARARQDQLTPSDVRGGTFTLSNHGVSGSLIATPIVINQPQSAILGIGKLEKRAVVQGQDEGDRIVALPKCYVTLTIDHRVMDGHQANRFLQVFVQRLETWS